jgi:replication factor C subunit 2/4
MFGASFKARVLELNASDERGISIVREKVKSFAQTSVSTADGGPGFKLIILDEADAMTGDAQSALRRTMEKYTKVTRFCLICNYVSRIIEPLASRCAKFRFRPLPREAMLDRLQLIASNEGVHCETTAYDDLIEASGGDLRRAITLLQSASNYNSQQVDGPIIYEVAGVLPKNALEQVWSAVQSGLYDGVADAVKGVLAMGYSSTMMTGQLAKMIVAEPRLDDFAKADMLLRLAEVDKCLVDGADEELQLMDMCCSLTVTWIKAASA